MDDDKGLPNPESGSDRRYSGASITQYVVENGQLPPDITSTQLQQLNKQMTQEEIVKYHTAVNRTSDAQKRETLIKEWIPKPHVVYHASANGEIDEFVPRPSRRRKDEPDSIFGATSKTVSAMFMLDQKNTRSGSYDGGETYRVYVGNPKEFLAGDKEGYMYTLPGDSFSVEPNVGLGFAEWTSTKTVKPTSKQHYPSAIQAMIENGVQIIPISMDLIQKMDDPTVDRITLLQEKQPVKSMGELRQVAGRADNIS